MSDLLNDQQKQAIEHTDSPLLVLAGAGSGKTRVITHKIAHLIKKRIHLPEHITAVTFTNKAAREMQQRVTKLLSQTDTRGLQVSTFHTLGLKIIRREKKKLGLRKGFTIYDHQDSSALIRDLLRKDFAGNSDIEDKIRWQISAWKNAFVSADQAIQSCTDPKEYTAAQIYLKYDQALRTYNAVDFDDLISLPAMLFSQDTETLMAWQQRIRYLLVDEYQDTNTAQYNLIKLLLGTRSSLTVVGDDDQSVYGWRGAQPENLNLLLTDFPTLKVVKLEQNYRSVSNILHLANHLIAHNDHQFEKRLWSALGNGDKVSVISARNADNEAEKVVSRILHHRFKHNLPYSDYAILYRGNHQSRPFERALREHQIPYHLSGGLSFFERSEIKDIMAYLQLLVNPDNDGAFLRSVNTPRRGLGPGTIEKLADFASAKNVSLFAACYETDVTEHLGARAYSNLLNYCDWINQIAEMAERGDTLSAIKEMIDDMQYREWVENQCNEPKAAESRLGNIDELLDWLARLHRKNPDQDLAQWLNHMTLMDILERDNEEQENNAVHLMTLHASKGLEFNHVYIVGMEEELLPHRNSVDDSLEEERRLAYVGITRARKGLTFTHAMTRRRYGELLSCAPSRFLEELPQDYLDWENNRQESADERKERGNAHLANLRSILAD
jgi:ATP-dependent DNA helicase Rep